MEQTINIKSLVEKMVIINTDGKDKEELHNTIVNALGEAIDKLNAKHPFVIAEIEEPLNKNITK